MEQTETTKQIWIFVGQGRFPSGVFDHLADARAWIATHRLTGTLTRYPVNTSVYDWALSSGLFTPNRPEQCSPAFIGGFSSAHCEHYHFEDGAS